MELLKSLTAVAITACFSSVYSSNVEAVVITTETGNGADSFIHHDNNTTNYGGQSTVWIKNNYLIPGATINNSRKAYFRFDLSSIADPISNARFELSYITTTDPNEPNYPAQDPSTYDVYGLMDGDAGENWSETGITWNNALANNVSSNKGVTNQASFLGTFILSNLATPHIISFTSSNFVDFLLNDTNDLVTLIIARQEENYSAEIFGAKESTSYLAPSLIINVPEPTTLALMGLGLAGIGYQRRRSKKTT